MGMNRGAQPPPAVGPPERTFSQCACCTPAGAAPGGHGGERAERRRTRMRQLQAAFLEALETARARNPALLGPAVVRSGPDGTWLPMAQARSPEPAAPTLAARFGLGHLFHS